MATQVNNSASLIYNFGASSKESTSNTVTTTLRDTYNLTASKTSLNLSWMPSENITYIITIANNGTEPIFAISIQDDLGGTPSPMTYLNGSGRININGVISTLIPTSTSPLTFVLPNPLSAGQVVNIEYVATVAENIQDTLTEITNVVTVVGHEVNESGPVITVNPPPSFILPIAQYAKVSITKSTDKTIVSSGEQLNYILTLENSGNLEAINVRITDQLPSEFTISSISSTTNGILTTYDSTDYSVISNRLVLPTSMTKTISVPPASTSDVGKTTILISGIINT